MRTLLLLSSLLFIAMSDRATFDAVRTNQDHALFFAVSNYENDGLIDLPQPIENAEAIAGELESRFGFKTEIVKNPTLQQIQAKLIEYQQKYIDKSLPSTGQLLIYFSGHGVKEYGTGYFLPSDADPDLVISTGLSYNNWRGFIDNLNCKHILVAIDACYSVTFDPNWQSMGGNDGSRFGRIGELSESERVLAQHQEYKSRLFYTSDSQEDVTPGRSNFARKLLEGLANHNSLESFMSAEELFASYIKKAQPSPKAGDFGKDDPRSNFLFFYETGNTKETRKRSDIVAYQYAQDKNTIEAYEEYMQAYPIGEFIPLARQKIGILKAKEIETAAWEYVESKNTYHDYGDFINAYPNSIYTELAVPRKKAMPSTYKKSGKYDRRPITAIEYNSYREVGGTIVDEVTNRPMIGANILAIDTPYGAVADDNGKFNFRIKRSVKNFSINYTGYITQEITVTNTNTSLEIKLIRDTALNRLKATRPSQSTERATNSRGE